LRSWAAGHGPGHGSFRVVLHLLGGPLGAGLGLFYTTWVAPMGAGLGCAPMGAGVVSTQNYADIEGP